MDALLAYLFAVNRLARVSVLTMYVLVQQQLFSNYRPVHLRLLVYVLVVIW